MTDSANSPDENAALSVATPETIKDFVSKDSTPRLLEPENLEQKATDVVSSLLKIDPLEEKAVVRAQASAEQFGYELQREAIEQADALRTAVDVLSNRTKDGGEVAHALINLKIQVEALDPAKIDLSPGWFSRFLGWIPGIGTPLKRYFSRYESAQTVISAIVRSLELGRDQLSRDNITLAEDQRRMRALVSQLSQAIELGKQIDLKLSRSLERDISPSDPRQAFISETVLFYVRQRTIDLQQQLAVTQQGILSIEILIRNNKELMRGVNRALSVTLYALQTAVTVALGLADQRIVLDKVGSLNDTTNSLIAQNAQRLRQQGAEIQKQAAGQSLELKVLRDAFADIRTAIDDIATFRKNALPVMAQTITEMSTLIKDAQEATVERERAAEIEPLIDLNFPTR